MKAASMRVLVGLAVALSMGTTHSVFAGVWNGGNAAGPGGSIIAGPAGVAPSGNFSWSNGGDINGKYGNPRVTPQDSFIFNPSTFSVNDTAGDAFSTVEQDTTSWDLDLAPGYQLTGLSVRVRGSFLVSGEDSFVDLAGTLSVQELQAQFPLINPRTFTGTIVGTPITFPVEDPSSGNYTAVTDIDLSFEMPIVDDQVHVELENILTAFADMGGNASINTTFGSIAIEIQLIPEPATLALLGFGAVALLRRRR